MFSRLAAAFGGRFLARGDRPPTQPVQCPRCHSASACASGAAAYTTLAMAESGLTRSTSGEVLGVLIANNSSKPTPLRGAA